MNEDIESLIEEHKNLIYKIASKYSKYYCIQDLFQVGVIGLLKAYKNFKSDFNTKFSTYAHTYIFGEIIEYIRNDRTMKVSSDILKIYKAYEKTREYLTSLNGKFPTLSEISEFMGVSEETIIDAIEKSEFVMSLDGILGSDDFALEKVIGNDRREEIDNLMDLRNELDKLSDRERKLIELRYYQDYTQSETAEALGINQVQVSRYEKQILKRIKTNIAA